LERFIAVQQGVGDLWGVARIAVLGWGEMGGDDGPIERFIEASKRMAAGGASAKHQIWTPRLRVAGARAIGDVDIAICVRLGAGLGFMIVLSARRMGGGLRRE
jgi:hypothetical protein